MGALLLGLIVLLVYMPQDCDGKFEVLKGKINEVKGKFYYEDICDIYTHYIYMLNF